MDDFLTQITCEEFYDDAADWHQFMLELEQLELLELNQELQILASEFFQEYSLLNF